MTFSIRAYAGWALLITMLSFGAYGIASSLQPLYLQWGELCKTDLQQSDYIVNFTRNEGALACLWFLGLGDAPQRPWFVLAAALVIRFAILATALALIAALFQTRAAAILATTWLVAKFGLWQAISSLNVVEQPAFGPRGIAGVQVLLGLLFATRGRPIWAAVAFGTGFYTQILNAALAALVVVVFFALNILVQSDRRKAVVDLSSFVGVLVLFGLPYVFTTGSTVMAAVSLKEWTAMRFLIEPDDTSLLFTFGWVGPEWYALHALGVCALGFVAGMRPRAWLQHPATRWLIAVWIVLIAAAACESLYQRLPDVPFVWVLQFQFRRITWLSGFLMVAAIATALVKAAGAPAPAVRRLGQTGLCVALALPLIRFYPSALAILLVLTLPAAALSGRFREQRFRLIACFVLAAALLSAPHMSLQIAEAMRLQQGLLGRLARTVDRAGVDLWRTLFLASAVALAPVLLAIANRRDRWRTIALAAYVVWFFGWPGITTAGGLTQIRDHIEGFGSNTRLSIAGWREFARTHDPLIRSLVSSGEYETESRRQLEDAARATERLTPETAVLLTPLDASQMRGITRRSVLILEDEDSDASQYSPLLWQEFRSRFEVVTGWDYLEYKKRQIAGAADLPSLRALYVALPPDRIRVLATRYGVTHVLTEPRHKLPFKELYRNDRYVLYQIGS